MKKIAVGLAAIFASLTMGAVGCQKQTEKIDVYMPDGAPALALALPMYEDKEEDGVEYHVVSSQVVQTYVTGKTPEAEVCVLPVNLAAKLLGAGETYKMAGVVTHGNMYFISTDEKTYTRENASELIGKTVGVVQLNNVPGLTLKTALNGLQIPYQELRGGEKSDSAVNLLPVDLQTLGGADVYLVPSPAADKRVEKTNFRFVGSLQELYGGDNGYPQAAIVVKNEVLENNAEWLGDFLGKIDENTEWLKTTERTVICEAVKAHLSEGLTPTFTAENLTDSAIKNSGVWLQRMDATAAGEVALFLRRLTDIDAAKAAVPNQAFYWMN